MNKIEEKMKNLADKYFNDSKAVELVEGLIDDEYTNTESIALLQEMYEDLRDEVDDLKDELKSLKENK